MVNTRKTKKAKISRIKRGGYNPETSLPHGKNIQYLKEQIRILESSNTTSNDKRSAITAIMGFFPVLIIYFSGDDELIREINKVSALPHINFNNQESHINEISRITDIVNLCIDKLIKLNEKAHETKRHRVSTRTR